jgi:hypothetical protein
MWERQNLSARGIGNAATLAWNFAVTHDMKNLPSIELGPLYWKVARRMFLPTAH